MTKTQENNESPSALSWSCSVTLCGILVLIAGIIHAAPIAIGIGIVAIILGLFEMTSAIDNMQHPRKPEPHPFFPNPPPDP